MSGSQFPALVTAAKLYPQRIRTIMVIPMVVIIGVIIQVLMEMMMA